MPANQGDTVKVHYTGKLDDGTVFDSSRDAQPIEFTLGQGQVIPGFETAIVGMEAGEEKTETIPVDQAYGPRRDDLVFEVEKEKLPEGMEAAVGQAVELTDAEGRTATAAITDVAENTVTLDANHPLAGRDLVFDIEVVDVQNGS